MLLSLFTLVYRLALLFRVPDTVHSLTIVGARDLSELASGGVEHAGFDRRVILVRCSLLIEADHLVLVLRLRGGHLIAPQQG